VLDTTRVLYQVGKPCLHNFSAIDEFYRTMNVLLLLDSAFGIFDNIQPRIDLSELDLQLPCDSIYFETASYQDMAITSLFPPRKMKLLDAYQKLFMEPTGDSGYSDTIKKISLNSWDLLVLIHRMYSCLFPIMSSTSSWPLCLSDSQFTNSSLLLCVATNLLQPASTHIINDCVPICHDLGSSQTRNAELENVLG